MKPDYIYWVKRHPITIVIISTAKSKTMKLKFMKQLLLWFVLFMLCDMQKGTFSARVFFPLLLLLIISIHDFTFLLFVIFYCYYYCWLSFILLISTSSLIHLLFLPFGVSYIEWIWCFYKTVSLFFVSVVVIILILDCYSCT